MKFLNLKYSLAELFNFKDSSRSERAKKNIIILFVLHVFNFLSIMAIIPVAINYLGKTDYGIWLTLASILSWLINLDFGLGNGLRNKLAEALALNDLKLAKYYISTAYAVFAIGIFSIMVIYIFVHGLFNWAHLLNAPENYLALLNNLVLYVVVLFLVQFLLKLLTSIINADQRPALNGVLSLIINTSTLVTVYLLSLFCESSLTIFGIVSASIPIIVFLTASLYLFNGQFKIISPKISYINFKYSSDLVRLGMQFFVIQISSLIVFTTGNIVITQLYGPEPVVTYNVAYRYFYIVPMVFNVVLAPFWSAFTEAYVKKEFDWIKNSMRKLIFIWLILSFSAIIMLLISNWVYKIWVGPQINVPFALSFAATIFVILANWNNIFGYFIYGVGKVRVQLYYSIFTALLNIPLSIYLAKYAGFGITGIMVSTIVCLIFFSIWAPIQYLKIINGKATGIWNK
ncbi:MAG: MATE family efflux transporter [Ignavibacteriales bacterium]|nr:MATE family efflux transporter [Ignavibacteriales bacterium]